MCGYCFVKGVACTRRAGIQRHTYTLLTHTLAAATNAHTGRNTHLHSKHTHTHSGSSKREVATCTHTHTQYLTRAHTHTYTHTQNIHIVGAAAE